MYLEYWGLSEKPFENTPDPRFMYNSPQHEEALARMLYVVREEKGAGMLTGVFGCGKTMLSRTLFDELEQSIYRLALLSHPRLDAFSLLKIIAYRLGAQELGEDKAETLIIIEKILENNFNDGKKTVIVIDEAHAIEDNNAFEEIRLLLNFQHNDKFLLTLLLLGQPELKEKVESNKQLLQRIAMRYHLKALSLEDTLGYIDHRLRVAGGKKIGFVPAAAKLIYDASGGIPRRINQLCDFCLLTGFSRKLSEVDEAVVKDATESLVG